MSPAFTIGQLASRVGVSADTIRYYERAGVLPAPPRSRAGYRLYSEQAVNRVLMVRSALQFGFSVKDIAVFLRVRESGGAPCRQVREAAQQLIDETGRRMKELAAARRSMQRTLRHWDDRLRRTPAGTPAHLLAALPRSTQPAPRRGRLKR